MGVALIFSCYCNRTMKANSVIISFVITKAFLRICTKGLILKCNICAFRAAIDTDIGADINQK